MRLIGCRCKSSDTFSWAVLIGRGLDHKKLLARLRKRKATLNLLNMSLFSFEGVLPEDTAYKAVSFLYITAKKHFANQCKVLLFNMFLFNHTIDRTATQQDFLYCIYVCSLTLIAILQQGELFLLFCNRRVSMLLCQESARWRFRS